MVSLRCCERCTSSLPSRRMVRTKENMLSMLVGEINASFVELGSEQSGPKPGSVQSVVLSCSWVTPRELANPANRALTSFV